MDAEEHLHEWIATIVIPRHRLRLQMQRLHGNSPKTKITVRITRNCWQDPFMP